MALSPYDLTNALGSIPSTEIVVAVDIKTAFGWDAAEIGKNLAGLIITTDAAIDPGDDGNQIAIDNIGYINN